MLNYNFSKSINLFSKVSIKVKIFFMDEKHCQTCYRPFEYRAKWKDKWEHVLYCSSNCSKEKNDQEKIEIEKIIIEFCSKRSPKSLCPSEIARELYGDEIWKTKMEKVRQVSRKLHFEKKIKITQNSKNIKSLNFKGPIRLSK